MAEPSEPPRDYRRETIIVSALVSFVVAVASGLIVAAIASSWGNGESTTTVPYVVGLRESLAVQAVEQAGLRPQVRRLPNADLPEGSVVFAQSPAEGTAVADGETVTVSVSLDSS